MGGIVKSSDYGSLWSVKIVNTGGSSGTEVEYMMEAAPGTLTSLPKWRVRKFFYDAGTNNVNRTLWADGNSEFDNVADNYASLDYY